MVKFQMADQSPKGKRRLSNAKGHDVEETLASAVSEPLRKYAPSGWVEMPITRQSQWAGGGANVAIGQPMFFSPMHTPQNWQIAQKRKECYQWARFYYENEPKVAAGVDFYGQFPMNGFELECRNKRVRVYFEHLVKELRLAYWLKLISHEYFLIGDVFPFLTIQCDHCGGSGQLKSGKPCNHPDGSFKNITILNPDFIEVEDSPIPGPKAMYMIPDDNLKRLVQRREPRKDFERLPPNLARLVASGQPIPLSPRSVSHIKHSEVGYSRYGTSLLRRLFTILAYKTKLMTANWIVAERLVLPVRVVKLGEKERPAGPEDIADMQNQLQAVANDPNLTIVTHHAFDYEWYGACNSFDTKTLCKSGWKFFDEITPDDDIMVFDPTTEKMRYEKPLARHEYDFDGELIHFEGNKFDLAVTPNHKMLGYKRDRETAFSMDASDFAMIAGKGDSYLRCNGIFDGEDVTAIQVGSHSLVLNDDTLKFIGYYLSEGHCTYDEETRRYIVSIAQSPTANPEKCDEIDRFMSNLGVKYARYAYDGRCTTWNILFKDFAKQWGEWFGHNSYEKCVPTFIKNLPPDKLKIILMAYLAGDGTKYVYKGGATAFHAGTTSKDLSNDLSEMMFKAGWSPIISQCGKKSSNQYMVYCNIDGGKGRMPRVRADQVSRRKYKGKVWCFTTSTGFFVTQRNGKIVINGNSGKIHNITGEWEQIGKEILDGLMLNQSLLNGEMQGYCLSADTKTLCDTGFKYHWEIDPQKDRIACYNPESKILEYHLPFEKVVYDYEGEMVHFQTDKIDILVTPNHRMWSKKRDGDKYEFITAENVRARASFIGKCDGYDGDNLVVPKFDNAHFSPRDYCKFIGYFVSEGYTLSSSHSKLGICQSENGKAREDIAALMSRSFTKFFVYRNEFICNDNNLYCHLRTNFGDHSTTKRLPSFIKNLSPEYLEIIIHSMLMGDGCITKRATRRTSEISYYTSSKQLAEDFAEIAFKCGYVIKISNVGKKNLKKRYFNKNGHEFISRHQQYAVHISNGFKGREPSLQSKSKKYAGKEIVKEQYSGKIYCFSVPHELFVTMRNGKITIQGNTSAQVGVETMIRRLENWRNTLSEWVEEHVFKPTAMMQGFIDEEATKQLGKTVYLYPTIKWNDMQLRDKTNKLQLLMQLHDKQIISTEKLCEEFDIDYDQEVERIRGEQVVQGPGGAVGAPGAPGGMPAPMGAGGGMPPGSPPADAGAAGGMPGAPGGAPGAPGAGLAPGAGAGGGAGGMAAGASGSPGKVFKRGKSPKSNDPQPVAPPTFVKLTKIEQRVWKALQDMKLPFPIYGQYKQTVHGEPQPYSMDFALPTIGLDVECLHPSQLVPTANGCKKAIDINDGELLIGRNGDYVTVNKKIVNKANGILSIKAHGCLPILVTKNHPMLVAKSKKVSRLSVEPSKTRYRTYLEPGEKIFVKSDEVSVGDFLIMPKLKKENVHLSFNFDRYNDFSNGGTTKELPHEILADREIGWLMGVYAAEGCCNPSTSNITFSFHINESNYISRVQRILLDKFGFQSSVYNDIESSCARVSTGSKLFAQFLEDSFGQYAPTKRIPQWMFNMPPEFVDGFLNGFLDGDGCVRENGTQRYVSSSVGLLSDLQLLLAQHGVFSKLCNSRKPGTQCSFTEHEEIKTYVTAGLWELSVLHGSKKEQHYEDNECFYVPIRDITKLDYNDDVINFSTCGDGESDHTYCVGNLISHNCDGKIWHEQEGAKEKDAERDRKLASYGWRVLRFNEDAVNEQMDEVTKVIHQNITEAAHERFSKGKKASTGEGVIRYASFQYPSSKVAYYKGGTSIDWDGINPSGVIQTIFGVHDGIIQLEADVDGGSQEDQGPGDQLEGNISGQIQIVEKEI